MITNSARENLLEIKRFINAPRPRVFAAWTRPEEIVKWFGPGSAICLSAKANLQIGGEYHICMKPEHAGETDFHGVYLEVKPPKRLVYTWVWKNHPLMGSGETLVTVEFLELDGGTEIHLRQEGFASQPLRDMHIRGWSSLDKLEGLLCEALQPTLT
jgi:uncharacterized protein YndB with AHSA1/START domain